jgi:hypothetical protein
MCGDTMFTSIVMQMDVPTTAHHAPPEPDEGRKEERKEGRKA